MMAPALEPAEAAGTTVASRPTKIFIPALRFTEARYINGLLCRLNDEETCMRKYLTIPIAAGLLLTAVGIQAGDAAAGKSKGMRCISCHGLKGVASNPQYPSIAGQSEAFLIAQMEAFKNGSRPVAAKSALFGGLSSSDFADLAAHYSQLPAGSAGSKADAGMLDKGKAGYESCGSCHGANGEGSAMGPRLAGQNAPYMIKRLEAYKDGTAADGSMRAVASGMSAEDMSAISEYLSSLK
jgi:cytochrome c553